MNHDSVNLSSTLVTSAASGSAPVFKGISLMLLSKNKTTEQLIESSPEWIPRFLFQTSPFCFVDFFFLTESLMMQAGNSFSIPGIAKKGLGGSHLLLGGKCAFNSSESSFFRGE